MIRELAEFAIQADKFPDKVEVLFHLDGHWVEADTISVLKSEKYIEVRATLEDKLNDKIPREHFVDKIILTHGYSDFIKKYKKIFELLSGDTVSFKATLNFEDNC